MVTLHPTVIVTGATGAIGAATVALLAGRGARVVVMARPSARLDALVKRLGGADKRVESVAVDLSSSSSVRAAAREINRAGGHVDALLNVAGVFTPRYQKTADGFEMMLATNHLGPFLLTNLLRDRLIRAGRVITVTAPSAAPVDIDRLLDKYSFDAMHTFGATRAANLMFTFELSRRAHRWDVRANAFHPGLVRSDLMKDAPRAARVMARWISGSAERAAQDLAELALSPSHSGTTGWLFQGTRRIDPPKQSQDAELQAALWNRSAEMVELEGAGF
ncbi:MAG TPA: SDR family NAD(P)-dependent oxidoreductase [Candidatus Dormibacteraeota bacterium]|nr:SDR family NAD(P)-dependent oxidoreductase [Candidatus Dormibacteraeota bacterium]